MKPGQRGRIFSLEGGSGFRTRLISMGLAEGTEVRVIRSSGAGPILVESGGARLALGRGMADRIIVDGLS
jgi:ferrous iron transport protein A